MPIAVVRIILDSVLETVQFAAGVAHLRERGAALVEHTAVHAEHGASELALLREGKFADWGDNELLSLCATAFGVPVRLGIVTYLSRGTDDDARAVLERFGISGTVSRDEADGSGDVTVTLARADMRRVPESRVHTALEAALNETVRIELVDAISPAGNPATGSFAENGGPLPCSPGRNPDRAPS